jgi:hypothetical protein
MASSAWSDFDESRQVKYFVGAVNRSKFHELVKRFQISRGTKIAVSREVDHNAVLSAKALAHYYHYRQTSKTLRPICMPL